MTKIWFIVHLLSLTALIWTVPNITLWKSCAYFTFAYFTMLMFNLHFILCQKMADQPSLPLCSCTSLGFINSINSINSFHKEENLSLSSRKSVIQNKSHTPYVCNGKYGIKQEKLKAACHSSVLLPLNEVFVLNSWFSRWCAHR